MVNTKTELSYKQTPIGRIPKEWKIVKLGEVIVYIKGKKPEKMIEENKESFLPYLSAGYLRNNAKTKFAKVSENIVLADNNDLILLWDGANAGEFFISKEGILSSTMIKIQPKNEMLEQKFLFYSLKLKENYLKGQTKGTGIPHVDKNVLNSINLAIPPFPEQQKIAEVLSTVDEVVQKVDEAIKKTRRLKKGLMQELLTKGIGHKEFKDTEIGRIPKEWKVVKLGEWEDVRLIMGQSPPSSSYNKNKEGLPFLQGKAEFGNTYPTISKYTTQPSKIAEAGDILISVRAPVGDVNLAPFKLCIGRGLAVIRVKEKSILFYFYWFQKIKNVIENIGKGSTFKAITKDELESFKIPVLPKEECQKTAEILSDVDKKLGLERKRKEKLERIKKGLMDNLLTGRKRINYVA